MSVLRLPQGVRCPRNVTESLNNKKRPRRRRFSRIICCYTIAEREGFVPESRLFCFVPHNIARVLGRPLAVLFRLRAAQDMLRGFESLRKVHRHLAPSPHNKNIAIAGVFF